MMTLYAIALKNNRKRYNVTQQWLAKKLHIARSTLASYEEGRREIPNSLSTEVSKILQKQFPDKRDQIF